MAFNNTIYLTGNLGSEVTIHEGEHGEFTTVSIATTDSYKRDDEWIDKDTLWHSLIAFNPNVVSTLKSLKSGARVKITGSISYRDFQTQIEDGSFVTKKEASVLVGKAELAPLSKKTA